MKSHAWESSHPPPAQKPCTAAMIGSGERSRMFATACPLVENALAWARSMATISLMFAPPEKPLSPPPVITRTLTEASFESSSTRPASSSKRRLVRMLTGGLFKVRMATGPRRSTRTSGPAGRWTVTDGAVRRCRAGRPARAMGCQILPTASSGGELGEPFWNGEDSCAVAGRSAGCGP
jgi:hypothetical protein